jgi:uncharacterized protein (TIGR02588 family)
MSDARGNGSDQPEEDRPGERHEAAGERRAGPLEIVATAISALLIASLLGVLIWDAFQPNAPPAFATHAGRVTSASGAYRVPMTVRNVGDDAAKEVVVHLELVASDSVLTESDITIDWLPGNTNKELVALFARPATGPTPTGVRAEVRGYVRP